MRRRGWLTASLAIGCAGVLAPAAPAATTWGYRLLSVKGTAVSDARMLEVPCRENSSSPVPFIASGRYEVSFAFTPSSRDVGRGMDRRADDGSVGPYITADSLSGRVITQYSEEMGISTGRGPGQGCAVTYQRCEGTLTRPANASAYVKARGPEFSQTYRRGVLIEWPEVDFIGAGGPCEEYGPVAITDSAWPRGAAPLRAFRPPPRVKRLALRKAAKASRTDPPGEFASTQQWTYRATMRLRRMKLG